MIWNIQQANSPNYELKFFIMKAKLFFIFTVVILFTFTTEAFSQRGAGNQRQVCQNIPDLTPEQEAKINSIRTARLSETTQHRAQMNELRAKRQSLRVSQNPDMNKLNEVIDQMADLRAQHMKASEAHHQSIREILTPEQRTMFDAKPNNRARFEQRDNRPPRRGQGNLRGDAPRGRRQ